MYPISQKLASHTDKNRVRLTFRAERLRPAAQLLQNKLTDRRAEVRSSDELSGGYLRLP
jgi:hypothetical protein